MIFTNRDCLTLDFKQGRDKFGVDEWSDDIVIYYESPILLSKIEIGRIDIDYSLADMIRANPGLNSNHKQEFINSEFWQPGEKWKDIFTDKNVAILHSQSKIYVIQEMCKLSITNFQNWKQQ
jgi:hypothetical protein